MTTKKNKVVNTSAEVRRDPLAVLMTVLPGGIEASEKRGQSQFVESEILPSQLRDYHVRREDGKHYVGNTQALLESWGFTFGKKVGGDTLFQHAKLPSGWSKKGSSHDMWSTIVDDKGRERCSIFYKAAFYDRDAFLNVSSRYKRDVEYQDKANRKGPVRGVVREEGGQVLFTGEWHTNTSETRSYEAYDQAGKDAEAWFVANLPDDIGEQWSRS